MSRKYIEPSVARAIRKYAPSINRYARKNYGISGKQLLARTVAGEGGGTTKHPNVSYAGARGPAQFIPSTRAAFKSKYGIDPWHSDDEAIHGMVIHLKSSGLAGYNPGDPGYSSYILHQRTSGVSSAKGGGGRHAAGSRPAGAGRRPSYIPGRDEFDTKAFIRDALSGRPVKGRLKNRATADFLHELADPNSPYRTVTAGKNIAGKVPKGQQRAKDASGAHPGSLKGTAMFEGVRVAAWIKPELEYARAHGWKGKVSSGFRSLAEQTAIYNSGVRPAAKPGTSNHEGSDFPRGAIDVTDAATLSSILRKKGSPLQWAGSKDPVHFSHPHGGSY